MGHYDDQRTRRFGDLLEVIAASGRRRADYRTVNARARRVLVGHPRWGREDSPAFRQLVWRTFQAMDAAGWVVLEGSTHETPGEKPQTVGVLIRRRGLAGYLRLGLRNVFRDEIRPVFKARQLVQDAEKLGEVYDDPVKSVAQWFSGRRTPDPEGWRRLMPALVPQIRDPDVASSLSVVLYFDWVLELMRQRYTAVEAVNVMNTLLERHYPSEAKWIVLQQAKAFEVEYELNPLTASAEDWQAREKALVLVRGEIARQISGERA